MTSFVFFGFFSLFFFTAESLHANTIYVRKTKISGDKTHLRPFTFSSLVFFWHNFAVKHAISAISNMICSYIYCSELTGSVLSS